MTEKDGAYVKVRIVDYGDPSVGIQEFNVYIDDEIWLDNEERHGFRKSLESAFNHIVDDPHVFFSDEDNYADYDCDEIQED